jgi:hypothetical protein
MYIKELRDGHICPFFFGKELHRIKITSTFATLEKKRMAR